MFFRTIPKPTFYCGDSMIIINDGINPYLHDNKVYIASCNSYFHLGQEWVKVQRKEWEEDFPIPVGVFQHYQELKVHTEEEKWQTIQSSDN